VLRFQEVLPAGGGRELLLLKQLGVVAEPERAGVDAYGLEARLLGLSPRPVMELVEVGRFVGQGQVLLGGLEMRIARAAEPDIALGVGRFRGDLRERLTRALLCDGDLDAGLALKFGGDRLAPLGLDAAVDVEAALRGRLIGEQQEQGHGRECECAHHAFRLHVGMDSRYSRTGDPGAVSSCTVRNGGTRMKATRSLILGCLLLAGSVLAGGALAPAAAQAKPEGEMR